MGTPRKQRRLRDIYNKFRRNRLSLLKNRLSWDKKEADLKSDMQKSSHSILWVWEFSKKAVLVCFSFYIVVQLYSMVVMVMYCDFTHLGELISQTGELVKDCVFAYFIKAGVENVWKINRSCDDVSDEPVG